MINRGNTHLRTLLESNGSAYGLTPPPHLWHMAWCTPTILLTMPHYFTKLGFKCWKNKLLELMGICQDRVWTYLITLSCFNLNEYQIDRFKLPFNSWWQDYYREKSCKSYVIRYTSEIKSKPLQCSPTLVEKLPAFPTSWHFPVINTQIYMVYSYITNLFLVNSFLRPLLIKDNFILYSFKASSFKTL